MRESSRLGEVEGIGTDLRQRRWYRAHIHVDRFNSSSSAKLSQKKTGREANQRFRSSDFQMIAGTNRDLPRQVEQGQYYFRGLFDDSVEMNKVVDRVIQNIYRAWELADPPLHSFSC